MRKAEAVAAAKPDTGYKPARQALLNYNLGRRLYAFGMPDKAEPKLKAPQRPTRSGRRRTSSWGRLPRTVEEGQEQGGGGEEGVRCGDRVEGENVVARTGLARVYWVTGDIAGAEREADEA